MGTKFLTNAMGAAALTAVLGSSAANAADLDVCNTETFDDHLAEAIIRGDVGDWDPDFLKSIDSDGWTAVVNEIDDKSRGAVDNTNRITKGIEREFGKGRLDKKWGGIVSEAEEKAPAIVSLLKDFKSSGDISAKSIDALKVTAKDMTIDYLDSAKKYVQDYALGAPKPNC